MLDGSDLSWDGIPIIQQVASGPPTARPTSNFVSSTKRAKAPKNLDSWKDKTTKGASNFPINTKFPCLDTKGLEKEDYLPTGKMQNDKKAPQLSNRHRTSFPQSQRMQKDKNCTLQSNLPNGLQAGKTILQEWKSYWSGMKKRKASYLHLFGDLLLYGCAIMSVSSTCLGLVYFT